MSNLVKGGVLGGFLPSKKKLRKISYLAKGGILGGFSPK